MLPSGCSAATFSTTRAVSSVEALSITITSSASRSWLSNESSVPPIQSSSLCAQIATLIFIVIPDIEQRRQSRLLAGLMIVLGGTSLLAAVITAIEALSTHTTPTFYVVPPVILLGIFYFINRSGRYRLAAYLFIIQTFAVVHFLPFLIHDISWLFFASMVMIISAI